MGLGQAEQNCTLRVHIISCLYCTVQLPAASLVLVLSTNHKSWMNHFDQSQASKLVANEQQNVAVGILQGEQIKWLIELSAHAGAKIYMY